jgi:hypothetical protein
MSSRADSFDLTLVILFHLLFGESFVVGLELRTRILDRYYGRDAILLLSNTPSLTTGPRGLVSDQR